jgi:hypothetical protein
MNLILPTMNELSRKIFHTSNEYELHNWRQYSDPPTTAPHFHFQSAAVFFNSAIIKYISQSSHDLGEVTTSDEDIYAHAREIENMLP